MYTSVEDQCNGNLNDTTSTCCSDENPCLKGQGDCDKNSECMGKLVCGFDNCHAEFSQNGGVWKTYDDCCTGKEIESHTFNLMLA